MGVLALVFFSCFHISFVKIQRIKKCSGEPSKGITHNWILNFVYVQLSKNIGELNG